MTSYGLSMLREVRENQEQLHLQYVWAGRQGATLVKRQQNSKVEIIRTRDDIRKLLHSNFKRIMNASMASSSFLEPSPKRR